MTHSIVMNPVDQWEPIVVNSHRSFIEPGFLLCAGSIYAREFSGEEFSTAETIPAVERKFCFFPQAAEVVATRSGFDLPSLFMPRDGWNGEYVGLLGQDPLRRGDWWAPTLTCCNPWGLSWAGNRTKRFGKMVWSIIDGITSKGYAVYLTDLAKIFVESRSLQKTPDLVRAEQTVFKAEVSAVSPRLWVTFGGSASRGATEILGDASRLVELPHPNARGHYLRDYFALNVGSQEAIADAMLGRILFQLAE